MNSNIKPKAITHTQKIKKKNKRAISSERMFLLLLDYVMLI